MPLDYLRLQAAPEIQPRLREANEARAAAIWAALTNLREIFSAPGRARAALESRLRRPAARPELAGMG